MLIFPKNKIENLNRILHSDSENALYRVPTTQGNHGKPGKKFTQGKPGKLRGKFGFYLISGKTQGRNFLSGAFNLRTDSNSV